MAQQDYNGWSNRATWNVALWLGNDEPNYRRAVDFVNGYRRRGDEFTHKDAAGFCIGLFGHQTPDGCKLQDVDWDEIKDAMLEMAGN